MNDDVLIHHLKNNVTPSLRDSDSWVGVAKDAILACRSGDHNKTIRIVNFVFVCDVPAHVLVRDLSLESFVI